MQNNGDHRNEAAVTDLINKNLARARLYWIFNIIMILVSLAAGVTAILWLSLHDTVELLVVSASIVATLLFFNNEQFARRRLRELQLARQTIERHRKQS